MMNTLFLTDFELKMTVIFYMFTYFWSFSIVNFQKTTNFGTQIVVLQNDDNYAYSAFRYLEVIIECNVFSIVKPSR